MGGADDDTIVEEQAALRRVAMLVAQGVESEAVFASVAAEAAALFDADIGSIVQLGPGAGEVTRMAAHGLAFSGPGTRFDLGPRFAAYIEQWRAGRVIRFEEDYLASTDVPAKVRAEMSRCSVNAAILVDGRLWGLLGTDHAVTARFNPDHSRTLISSWSSTGTPLREGARSRLGGRNVHTIVFDTGGPARIDDYATGASGMSAEDGLAVGLRAAVAVPISIEGRLWGSMAVATTEDEPLPAGTEERLSGFTALAATAIANAEARVALTASRERIVVAADATGRRIERELRDATQERLVSLVTQLKAAQAAAPEMSGLGSVLAEADDVLEQLRKIARGLHPSALADGGLPPALTALARNSAVPVRLDVRVPGRLAERAELTAYYAVSEALTNTAKHAHASMADVTITVDDRTLRVRVRDDGTGGADFSRGSGLTGLRDRVEAVGGQLSLRSPAGAGTTVEISLPR